jgi:hypothetical protein
LLQLNRRQQRLQLQSRLMNQVCVGYFDNCHTIVHSRWFFVQQSPSKPKTTADRRYFKRSIRRSSTFSCASLRITDKCYGTAANRVPNPCGCTTSSC